MGAQDDNGVATPPEDGVAIALKPEKKQKRRVGPRKRLVILGIICLVVLAGVAFGTYKLVHKSTSQVTTTTTKTSKAKTPTTATEAVVAGDNTTAQKLLDQQISAATTNAAKADLYNQKAGIAYSDKDYKDSLTYAQKAESLDPSQGSAEAIADTAAAQGNKTLAIKYYKLQLQRMQPVQNVDDQTRVEAKITALGGTN